MSLFARVGSSPLSNHGVIIRSNLYQRISTSRSVRSTSWSHAADHITWRINGRAVDDNDSHCRTGASASLRIINSCSSLRRWSAETNPVASARRKCGTTATQKATRSSTTEPSRITKAQSPKPKPPSPQVDQIDQCGLATALCFSRGRRYYMQIRP